MFTVRDFDYVRDIEAVARCYHEGFFRHEATPATLRFARDIMGIITLLGHVTLVAEADGEARGYLVGRFHAAPPPPRRRSRWPLLLRRFAAAGLNQAAGRYRLPRAFREEFRVFLKRVGQLEIGRDLPADAEVTNLASRREWRRGVGTALMDAFAARCRDRDCRSVRVLTETLVNHRFYERYGFVRVRERAMRLPGGLESAALLYLYAVPPPEPPPPPPPKGA